MGHNIEEVQSTLRDVGWCWLPAMSDEEYRRFVMGLGRAWCETEVQLRPDVLSYLCRPDAVPLHTDHPDADYMSWRCERQDSDDGAQLLLDGRTAIDACGPAVRDALNRVHVEVRVRAGEPPSRIPVVRHTKLGERVFFASWLNPVESDPHSTGAYEALRREVDRLASQHTTAVRLDEGEVLLIDNGRILHGRGPLSATSNRLLRRFWITVDRTVSHPDRSQRCTSSDRDQVHARSPAPPSDP